MSILQKRQYKFSCTLIQLKNALNEDVWKKCGDLEWEISLSSIINFGKMGDKGGNDGKRGDSEDRLGDWLITEKSRKMYGKRGKMGGNRITGENVENKGWQRKLRKQAKTGKLS